MNGGGGERYREREGEGEKADTYCGCLMTGRGGEIKGRGRNVKGEVLRRNEKNPGRGEV